MPLTRIRQTAIGNDSITSAKLAHDLDLDGDFVRVPHGTTAQRPSSPVAGYMRFNTDQGTLEQWNTTTNSWQAIDSPPIITSLAYSGSLTAVDPAGGETITLTGTNFKSGATVTVGGTSATSVSVVGSTSITFTTPAKTAGDYDVIVINANGLQASLTNGISYNGTPAFTTAAGNVGSILEDDTMSTITIVAAEPDGGTLAYSVTSGALPTGVSLGSANGQLTGTPNTNVTSNTTYNFTVTATDDENQTNSRAFNLIVLRPIYATQLNNSVRFDDNRVAFLTRIPSSAAGDRRTWTWSAWVKRGNLSYNQAVLFSAAQSQTASKGTTDARFVFGSDDKIYFDIAGFGNLGTAAVFRDTTAWYHVVAVLDTTQATQSDRLKIYVNGIQQSLSGGLTINQNDEFAVNNNVIQYLGYFYRQSWVFDGYLSDIHFIDGQALTPTSFAEEYYGVWATKAYSGSYGTNGFHLDFETDSQDSSGNNNHWIPNSLGGSLVKYSGSNLDYPNNLYKILDGDNSTAASIQGPNTSTSASFIYTPATPITVSSSLKFKYSTGQTDCKYKINGGSYVNLGSSGTVDFDTGFTGTLTSIEWYVANSNSLISIYDLRVDDVQVINYDIGYDDVPDSPTNNFATWSSLTMTNAGQLQNGNLKGAPEDNKQIKSTFSMPSGKWYWENKIVSGSAFCAGICPVDLSQDTTATNSASSDTVQLYYDGRLFLDGVSQGTITTFSSSDIIGVTYDASIRQVTFYKNGSQIGQYTAPSTTRIYTPFISAGGVNAFTHSNFGQDDTFGGTVTAGGNADGNGIGNFKYSVPSGFLALCSKNLAESTMNTSLDDRPEDYMNKLLYTGTGTTHNVTGVGFQPDFVWIKNRDSGSDYHNLYDSVRGINLRLYSNDTNAEEAGHLTSFNSDGFTLDTSNSNVNGSSTNYVAWNWKAGGAPTASNVATSGAMTANSVSLNGTLQSAYTPDASVTQYPTKMSINTKTGFSIVSWTGNGSAGTWLPHGLNSTPEMMILKGLDNRVWSVYHKNLTSAANYLQFNSTNGESADGSMFNSVPPNDKRFVVGSYNVVSNVNYIGYFWHSVPGYSRIGFYQSSGFADGVFVELGFKPAWVLIKSATAGRNWTIWDNVRGHASSVGAGNNPNTTTLFANAPNAETHNAGYAVDFTANGFKTRGQGGELNTTNEKMMFMAFAEDPFKYSEAK